MMRNELPRIRRPMAVCAMLVSGWVGEVCAQALPLAPTSDTIIPVSASVLHYSSIDVPAGVTVWFVAAGPDLPAVVVCDGDAVVHGTLSLSLVSFPSGPGLPAGWVDTGAGTAGISCGAASYTPPGGGRHDHGSLLPFGLEGGSPGGGLVGYDSTCTQSQYYLLGGHGGGTLVLLAGGSIEVHGVVVADGSGGISGGSGGSILLRGEQGVSVLPGGSVTARGGAGQLPPSPYPPDFSTGQDGLIRFDAWGQTPNVLGTVDPAPAVIELPYLYAAAQPSIGTTWMFDVYAPASGWVYVAASLSPANGPLTPFGALGIDLAQSAPVAIAAPQPSPDHDPHLLVQWPIPNSPTLIGFAMWLQAIAAPQALPTRLSNTLAVTVQ